jgi:Domain of unknown function (DUF4280)
MEKKYIPEGCWLACNKGTSPSDFRISHNNNSNIYGAKLASEADKIPFFNIKPMGICTVKYGICTPSVPKWDNPQEGVTVNGYRLLKEDSTCKCVVGGTIKIYFSRAAAAADCALGPLKKPSEHIKEGFDSLEKATADARKARDAMLPDLLKKPVHAMDWVGDTSTGLVEGAASGIASTGEALYQIRQDPVGTVEAIGSMAKSGYDSASAGLGAAKDWASSGDNWVNAASATKNWVTSADNWKNAATGAWDSVTGAGSWVVNNPRALGSTVGEFIPDAAAAVYTGGGATAAKVTGTAAAKKLGKETAEEVAEKVVKEKADDVIGPVIVKTIPKWKGPTDYSKINSKKYKIGEGKEFSQAQKDALYEANMKHNDGLIRSDLDGSVLERPGKSMSGVTPSPLEAQIDHISPRSGGGTNGFDNAQILSREQNRAKWDN